MRRPLPPELIELGDELESAAARALGRRRTRRALALNAMASLAIAVPLGGTLVGTVVGPPAMRPETFAPRALARASSSDDFPPRVIPHVHKPVNRALLASLPNLRRVLR